MKSIILIGILFLSFLSYHLVAQNQQVVVPYTLADRDRAIITDAKISALDTKISALDAKMEVKFESQQRQFESQQRQLDDIKTLFYWGFGILISLFIFMLGYSIWDRRTALLPALDKATNADVKSTNLASALREYSKKHADLAEILKSHGVL